MNPIKSKGGEWLWHLGVGVFVVAVFVVAVAAVFVVDGMAEEVWEEGGFASDSECEVQGVSVDEMPKAVYKRSDAVWVRSVYPVPYQQSAIMAGSYVSGSNGASLFVFCDTHLQRGIYPTGWMPIQTCSTIILETNKKENRAKETEVLRSRRIWGQELETPLSHDSVWSIPYRRKDH